MQNFSNSPAPPTIPPGFSGRSVGGSPYPPLPVEPQISPRMTEDYVGLQQQSIHRGHHHPSQASHMLAYGARNRGALEPPPTQGGVHTGNNNNPYRKEAMDYYFSMCGKDRHRRGGMAYGGGFGYPGIDGHLPHQYRHAGSGSAASSGLMSPYPVDYGSGAGSVGTAGAFSPSHQYNLNQNPVMQSVPGSQMQQRQHGQSFAPVHHAQQQRSYQHSGHRMTPQYPHYSPQGGASTGSSGMYSPPPHKYVDGVANTSFDAKVNSSPSVNASSNSVSGAGAANNVGPVESVQPNYPASNYSGYLPQSHSLHKQATLQHRNSQHSSGVGHDGSLKMPHQGPSPGAVYAKHHQAPNPSIAQPSPQEIAKSPMHSNAQQTHMNQNFSPISNPSPAASAVHSPSCSSSPSPLMGVSEAPGSASNHGPPMSGARSSHGRLLQTAPQLSPTPNSNSSISSCGSSGSQKAHSLSAVGGSNLPPVGRNKMSQGSREEGSSVYSTSSLDRMQDAGLNSLNALSSQVANLPNTVQHMLLTDTVFSQKKRDGGQMPQAAHCAPPSRPRSRNLSAASSGSTVKDVRTGDGAEEDSNLVPVGAPSGAKVEREEQLSEGEHGKVRQVSGGSAGFEAAAYNPTQTQAGQACSVKTGALHTQSKEAAVTETKTKEANIPSSAVSPSSEGGLTLHSAPPVSSSPSSSNNPPTITQNCVPETGLAYNDHRGGEVKKESEAAAGKTQKVSSQMQQDGVSAKNGQEKESMLHSESQSHSNKEKEKQASEEQQIVSSVGVIVSSHTDKSKHPQDNCVEEKMSLSYSKEASSHNGEEGVDLSLYSAHHQKSNSARTHNPPQPAAHKYSYPESTYGSDLSMKNRARAGSASVMETNPRYFGYQHSQTAYGPVPPKDGSGSVAEALVKRGHGGGSKAQEDNSQMQQFPSLLQEVLQGYNLDRRYGRPEQTFPARHQAPQQFPARHSLGLTEGARMQGGVPEGSNYSAHIGKPTNQKHASEPDFASDMQPLVKSEVSNPKILQNAEKSDSGVSQSLLKQAAESQQPPAKHINLSDYSVPQRKPLSNVQELLLQEPEPLTLISQSESQKTSGSTLAASERRSVICDVSPNRRGTPEREREAEREKEREKSQSGASVIQKPFFSPAAPSDLSKKDVGEKQVKMEAVSKESGNSQTENHSGEYEVEYHSKNSHLSAAVSADPYRRGAVDVALVPPRPVSMTALSSPARHHSYLHGVDLSSASGGTFPGYRYGDSREDNVMSRTNLHYPFHHLPPQSQSSTKLQMYPHPRGPPHPPHDMGEWVKAINRPPKEMMMQQGASPGRHKVNQSEQRQRLIPPADMQVEHTSKTQPVHHPNPYYDMKMWESTHPGREGARMMEGDAYYRAQPPLPAPPPVASHSHISTQIAHSHGAIKLEASRGAPEEAKHPCPPPPPVSSKPPAETNATQPQAQRPTKAGGSGDTNPLILRRRVRSFISPIPAKRLLQDAAQQRAATNSHHSPGVQSEPSHHNDDDSSSAEMPCPRLSSPQPGENAFIQPLSPSGGNTKVLAARKGRGLKLEAIVQKITPNIKKPAAPTNDESNHYPGFLHSELPTFNESQDQDLAHFPRVAGGEDSYMDESPSLNNMIPFRGVDETGPLPAPSFPCDSHQTSQIKQQDFDFGLGASVASASGDKEDFALLGPLPPPPPLPRPVQGSPPPSSSALSDIQHFTNTYQQLETRRGEHSAANLLRQKLQESGMGFDDYPGSDYYGTTPPHQGHMLNRQHQMSSGRSSLSPTDSKPLENVVPKGYFPSGKKKGRPVGSVNKQKRAQTQVPVQAQAQVQPQNTALSVPPAPTTPTPPTPAPASTPPAAEPPSSTSTPTAPPLSDNASTPPLAPPVLTQAVKADAESEDTQPEIETKQVRRRRRGAKVDGEPLEARGRQRRRRRAPVAAAPPVSKDEPEAPLGAAGSLSSNRGCADPSRKGLFIPHIHVEKKIPEIGAVCTIVNAEDDRMKGERSAAGGKAAAGGGGIDSLLTSALSSQLSRRDRELEKRETDEVETALQSGKALPSSGYVVTGPVITETNHSGRLLCCLCQKWANYKHLGDLYGPYYPAEYAAKLPKNQPQIRQCQATTGPNKTGPNSDTDALAALQVPQTRLAHFNKPSSETDSSSSNPSDRTASAAATEETATMMTHMPGKLGNTLNPPKTPLTWDKNPDMRPIPELKREPDLESDRQQQQAQKQPQQLTEDTQQRPQHRKLTSHPRFKRRHKSSEDSPRMVPSNSKASLPFQPPPPALDSLGPLAQLAQLPLMPMDPEELWVHEGCIVWTSGVYLVNGRLYGLQEALDGARETSCSFCEMVGSTLGCYSKGCTLRYHYLCAIEADCSLNEDNFSLRCPKHKVKKESLPRASGLPSQCMWSSPREAEGSWDKEEQDLASSRNQVSSSHQVSFCPECNSAFTDL
ncbi:transcription factor 20 isoform 1-T1 [Fundulus diaphanus]